ncbi:MAG: cysteine desulfurase [Bacteroidales bacterium]|jgi:cysteine desulfurase/selenocysteine lyase|nr:cysteine desulfurase [Bacteroidales bacterium]
MNREDFIILDQKIYDRHLVYFDNAATTQKPEVVLNAMSDYYRTINSNIHRGAHYLSQRATDRFEQARQRIQAFINAVYSHEVIFTRGTTESINLVASSFGKAFLFPGDEVIISGMEHHSNIVPWQLICEEKGAKIKVIPFDERGALDVEKFEPLITDKTKIVAITHVSNSLGTINPVKQIIDIAHSHGIPVMLDGAQAISHIRVDVQALDCDFYCFSGHKMYGPMGIGVMYGKEKWLEKMPPYQGGGEMIKTVTLEKSTYADLPFKFEAGTPSVGDVIGLEKAIEYIENIGLAKIAAYEEELLRYGVEKLSEIEDLDFVGTAPHKAAIISFNLKGIHPYDAGVIIDRIGVAVRTGHHCTQPVMDIFCIPGTIRASFALYNEKSEIDRLVEAVRKVKTMFK